MKMSVNKFFCGTPIGRAILMSVLAYIIWTVYTTMTKTEDTPETRRFGGRSRMNRYGTRSNRRFGRR